MTEIDMVIISWAATEELKSITMRGLNTLLLSEDPNKIKFNIFIIESNKEIEYATPNTITIHPDVPYGYHRYLNIGRKMGNADYVCLCNSDLIYYRGWATEILNMMEEYPRVLSAGAFCPRSHPLEHGLKPFTGLKYGNGVGYEVTGHFIFQRRKIYEIIGDLDEQFEHWCCDWDYANTLDKHNIQTVLVTSALVDHRPYSKTLFNRKPEEVERLSIGQYEKFYKKWGDNK